MMTSLSQPPDDASILALKPIIFVFHDESTFYANADQTFNWSDVPSSRNLASNDGMCMDIWSVKGKRLDFTWNTKPMGTYE
jgi:hypothetical protein